MRLSAPRIPLLHRSSAPDAEPLGPAPERPAKGSAPGSAHLPPSALAAAPAALRDRALALAHPQAVLGVVVESLWTATHLTLYPFGARGARRGSPGHGYRIEHLSPVQRGMVVSAVAESGTPILLLHGMADNQSIFMLLRRGLQRRGFSRIYSMNYSVFTQDVRTAAAQLAEEVERIVEETHYDRIHIVAHSLGGIVSRYYVTRLGGDERVHTIATLGSPHEGTLMAHLLPTRLAQQLRPHSALMRELAEPAPGCRTRFLVFWSDADAAILPSEAAELDHPDLDVTSVFLKGVGHLSLPILPSVVHRISTSLAQLDSEGEVTGSVTELPLGRRRPGAR